MFVAVYGSYSLKSLVSSLEKYQDSFGLNRLPLTVYILMPFPKERRSGSFYALHMRHMLDRKIICHYVLLEKERIQAVAKNLAITTHLFCESNT